MFTKIAYFGASNLKQKGTLFVSYIMPQLGQKFLDSNVCISGSEMSGTEMPESEMFGTEISAFLGLKHLGLRSLGLKCGDTQLIK